MELSESEISTDEEEIVIKGGKKHMVLSDDEDETEPSMLLETPEAAAPSGDSQLTDGILSLVTDESPTK